MPSCEPVSLVIPANDAQIPKRNPKIPVEVSYPVMDEERDPPSRRAVRIAINMKVSKEILPKIALEIKAKEIEQYERTLVRFYLPPYWDGKDNWANAFFDPTLEVEILGLEEGQDRVVAGLKVTLPENSNLIGSWLSQETSFLITIYEAEGKYYMMRNFHNRKKKYPESDSAVFDLAKLQSTEKPTFQFSPIHKHGDKFVVSENGDLIRYCDAIMNSVAKPVKKFEIDRSKR